MKICPKTAVEAWKRLDRRLTIAEKKEIREAKDLAEFHFGHGMWIRNYWIYRGERENLVSLLKDLGVSVMQLNDTEMLIGNADMYSSAILDAYQKHLKEKLK